VNVAWPLALVTPVPVSPAFGPDITRNVTVAPATGEPDVEVAVDVQRPPGVGHELANLHDPVAVRGRLVARANPLGQHEDADEEG